DLERVGGVGLGMGFLRAAECLVEDEDFARLAVQLEEDKPLAGGVRVADGQELDNQRLALLDVYADFFAGLHAVEEDGRWQHAGVGILVLMAGELGEDPRIEELGDHVAVVDTALELLFQLAARGREIGGRQAGAGAAAERLPAAEHALLKRFREAAG